MLLRRHKHEVVQAVENTACNASEINVKENKRPTKTEVSRMSVDELKAYAPTIGIEVTDESTGAKLKEQIIAKLGL